MTKGQFIELVKRNLQGGDAPAELLGRFDPREIELYISMAFDSLINQNPSEKNQYRQELGLDNWKYDNLTKVFFVPILDDPNRKKRYSEIPAHVVSVIDNNGIRMIYPKYEEQTVFLPRKATDNFLMDGLDVNQLSGLIYYTVENRKVYYSGDINCDWTEVAMKLALKFTEFEDTDEVEVPDGTDIQIMSMVLQLMLGKPPMDIVNDGTAQQTTR